MDPLFRVEVLSRMENPQRTIWMAMHQDYSEKFVFDEMENVPDEKTAGELVVKHLLAGGKGHFGPIEHPQIVLNVGYFPHSMMQQLRTHRVGVSFDVQSGRYTGKRILEVGRGRLSPEQVFYLRPVGHYTNRQGAKYDYTQQMRNEDILWCIEAANMYRVRVEQGLSEEHARGLIPFDIRQHFVMSCNMRSLMHLLDLRWKKDAQLEIQQFCDLLYQRFEEWTPEIAHWYMESRGKKARLSP